MSLAESNWLKQRWEIIYDAFSHDVKVIAQGTSGAKEAYELLVNNELERADLSILKSIKQIQREGTVESQEGDFLNLLVCELISVGRYQSALTCTDFLLKKYESCTTSHLLLINRSEALHNLGRSEEALDNLAELEPDILHPLCANGLWCLRAWILIGVGKFEPAIEPLDAIDARALLGYLPEICYTRAAYFQAKGDFSEALKHAEQGHKHATKGSSVRNGLIMRASILSDLGQYSEARQLFDEAASFEYRGQAAYGLLRTGLLELRQRAHSKSETLLLRQSDLSENLQKRWQTYDPESQLSLVARV